MRWPVCQQGVFTTRPHVFVGEANINGAQVPDGTVVAAWVEVIRPPPLIMKATATGVGGQTATNSLNIEVFQQLAAGEGLSKTANTVSR